MLKNSFIALAVFAAVTVVNAQTPVAPALYVKASDIASALEQAAAQRPAMAVSSITTSEESRINLIRRTEAAGAIVHQRGTELHFITEGAGTIVTGGVVIRPADGGRATIEGDRAVRVSTGDAVLIPEGTPHWYSAVEGAISYLEVRFNVAVAE
jgi:mannose-6-phosphate isomerase-like protein (cupin superfamily)